MPELNRKLLFIGLFLILLFIYSCEEPAPVYDGTLRITEVGALYYSNSSAWVEIYNPSNEPANLSQFTLRTTGFNQSTSQTTSITDFTLPSLIIQPGGYAILRGKAYDHLINSGNVVYLKTQDNIVPFWMSSSSVELAVGGYTIDFVRFGNTSNAPLTENAWSGNYATALPYTTDAYGKSLARNGANADTNTPGDWTIRSFATPGGPNDVTSTTDNDEDGIPDANEAPGTTFAGLPLYDWGARAGTRDIFVHVNYMSSSDPGITPNETALNSVKDAFAAEGIAIHFDVGNLFDGSSGSNPARFDLDDKNHAVPFGSNIDLGETPGYAVNLYTYKYKYMDLARRGIFHYLIFANSIEPDGLEGSSGLAEVNGNDVIISLGDWGLVSGSNELINYQAGTVMHELGHNLGLRHGGDDDENDKPNYLSIMNYLYQLDGLPTIGNQEGDRYLNERHSAGLTLTNPPSGAPANFKISYSHGTAANLNESSINENNGLGMSGSTSVDFNNNSSIQSSVSYDTNGSGLSVLNDYDDWGNLNLFFMRSIWGDMEGAPADNAFNWTDPVGNDYQPVYHERCSSRPGPG